MEILPWIVQFCSQREEGTVVVEVHVAVEETEVEVVDLVAEVLQVEAVVASDPCSIAEIFLFCGSEQSRL